MNVSMNSMTQLAASLSLAQSQQQSLSSEISSGVRITGLGDDPVASAQNVQLNQQIVWDSSFTQTASTSTARMQVTDATLGSVVDQINQAISVATAGNNGIENASDRSSITSQLTNIRDEILGLANTSYSGSYLFAGSQNGAAPFTLDTSTTPATAVYGGDDLAHTIATPGGQSIAVNLPGDQVFNASGASLLGTLNSLIAGFASGDTALTTSLTPQLSTALSQVSAQRASLDSALNRLQSASSYAGSERTQLLATQTSLLQADLPTVATQLSSNSTQQSALESVIVSIEQQGTLFNRM